MSATHHFIIRGSSGTRDMILKLSTAALSERFSHRILMLIPLKMAGGALMSMQICLWTAIDLSNAYITICTDILVSCFGWRPSHEYKGK